MPCLDDDAALAFARGELRGQSLDAASEHIDGCADCRRLVAAAAGGRPPGNDRADESLGQRTTPERIGRFEVEGVAGRGAMGIVYRGRDMRLDRPVALKVIAPERLGPGSQQRLEREARALAKVRHHAVVGVYEVGDTQGSVFVAMELVPGDTLEAWLAAKVRTEAEIVARFVEAGEGLLAAHQAGLVHRDFKPSNAMLDEEGQVRVTDFGLVSDGAPEPLEPATAAGDLALTQTGAVVGTPAYMAPEQLHAMPPDPRSDQFSFCVALFEALAGHRPYAGATLLELSAAIEVGRPRVPARSISRRVHRALRRGLAPRPEDRFASMRELLDELVAPARPSLATGLAVIAGVVAVGAVAWVLRDDADVNERSDEAPPSSVATSSAPPDDREVPSPPAGDDSPCAGVDQRWAATWTEERKAAVRRSEVESTSERPPAHLHPKLAERWQGIRRVHASFTVDAIGRFGDTWRSLVRETCADPKRTRTATADLRRGCLEDARVRVEALLDDPPPRMRDALAEVRGHLTRCRTPLVESLSLPDGEVGNLVAQARDGLAKAAAARWAGDGPEAKRHAEGAVALAQRSGDPTVLAEAWLEHGRATRTAGGEGESIESLHRAVSFAQPAEHHRVYRESAEALAWGYAFGAGDVAQARRWLDTAKAMDGTVEPTRRERGRRQLVRAELARRESDRNAEIVALQAALAEPLDIDVVEAAVDGLAEALRAEGRGAELSAALEGLVERHSGAPSVVAAVARHRAGAKD